MISRACFPAHRLASTHVFPWPGTEPKQFLPLVAINNGRRPFIVHFKIHDSSPKYPVAPAQNRQHNLGLSSITPRHPTCRSPAVGGKVRAPEETKKVTILIARTADLSSDHIISWAEETAEERSVKDRAWLRLSRGRSLLWEVDRSVSVACFGFAMESPRAVFGVEGLKGYRAPWT